MYNQKTWTTDELVTAADLNNMESGIAANDTAIPVAATESNGTISFENSSGATLFSIELPLYDGGVS